ncbi:MAG TPA: alkaline phosphatase family protein [Candidatus Limnocylindria bacterium]|jgi:predicted AlkP superfamily pyrophosphatase or phosphodiesterase|nr:alkaline phosphatase family protein [Candidatus Limnocylindria bacterium]
MPRFTLFLLAFLALVPARAQVAPLLPKDRTVVLITIDGFPAWLWADPTLPVPTLRRLAAEGAQASTMKVSNPAVTWINHTTLVTGVEPARHGVLFNGLLVRQGPGQVPMIEQWAVKSRLVHVPTVYDLAHQAGLTTAQVDWVAVTNSGTMNCEFHEIPDPAGEIPRELVAAGVLTQPQLDHFAKDASITWRDMVWTKAATHILRTRKPNLLLLHLLTTDSVNHRYGPGTLASFTAYAYVDRLVAEVLEELKTAGLQDRTTVIITTDHGFKEVTRLILPNVALRQAGLVRAAGPTVTGADAYVMTQGGMAFVYVTDPARKAELVPRLKTLLGGIEGVDRVVEPKEYAALGIPRPEMNDGAGELLLYAKPGYAFQASTAGDQVVQESLTYLGTHGYPNDDPKLDGIFLASGYGIKPGAKLDRIANLDVAPTVAELLGLKLPNPSGRVLFEILK